MLCYKAVAQHWVSAIITVVTTIILSLQVFWEEALGLLLCSCHSLRSVLLLCNRALLPSPRCKKHISFCPSPTLSWIWQRTCFQSPLCLCFILFPLKLRGDSRALRLCSPAIASSEASPQASNPPFPSSVSQSGLCRRDSENWGCFSPHTLTFLFTILWAFPVKRTKLRRTKVAMHLLFLSLASQVK